MAPQVQLDQPGNVCCLVLREPQRRHPLLCHLGPNHVVVVEGHRAIGRKLASARLADVMQQRGQPGDEVGATVGKPGLQRQRLVEHRQGVLVHVLVPVVLVSLQAQRRELRQHMLGQPGLDEEHEPEPRMRRLYKLHQLIAHPLGRHDLDARSELTDCPHHLRRDREA